MKRIKNNKKIVVIVFIALSLYLTTSCKKKNTFEVTFKADDKVIDIQKVKNNSEIVVPNIPEKKGHTIKGWDKEIGSINSETIVNALYEKNKYVVNIKGFDSIEVEYGTKLSEIMIPEVSCGTFVEWKIDDKSCNLDYIIEDSVTLTPIYEYNFFDLTGPSRVQHGNSINISVDLTDKKMKLEIEWEIEGNENVSILSQSNTALRLRTLRPGEITITAKTTYNGIYYSTTKKIVIVGAEYNISYNLPEEFKNMSLPTKYNTTDFPIKLPILEKEGYIFVGWQEKYMDNPITELSFDLTDFYDFNFTPVWIFPHLDVLIDSPVINLGETKTFKIVPVDVPNEYLQDGYKIEVRNSDILSVKDYEITPISCGYTEIIISLKEHPEINVSLGITVSTTANEMDEVLKLFASMSTNTNMVRIIDVVGWQLVYKYNLISSLTGYLFEDLEINENIAPITNGNRPGTKKQKYYICVHDTGDIEYSAKQWSQTVYNEYNEQGSGSAYSASFQYVVGNDGIYHNIPDDEVAYHAGDGTAYDYKLLATGVKGTNKYPKVSITSDGYYALDGSKTSVKAPTNNGKILTASDINDCGIRCVLQNGEYYLGQTYYNTTYRKISNRCGNTNSIGIESCINTGTDIYLTWQRLAKLVAYLMDQNSLTIDDVVPHHYFSGKNCPQTIRQAGLWNYFKQLVVNEYNILQYTKLGYKITLSVNDENVASNGRVIKLPNSRTLVKYTITVSKDGNSSSITLGTMLLSKDDIK